MDDPGLPIGDGTDQEDIGENDLALYTTGTNKSAAPPSVRRTDNQAQQPEGKSVNEKKEPETELYYDPDDHGFRRIVRNFSPSWFIVTMGTGVLSLLLHQNSYNGHWLRVISIIFFVLNVVLFVLFFVISCLRYTMYPEIFPAMIRHPTQSLFLGTFPVGLATIIDMIVLVCAPAWGNGMVILAWALWWIDGVIALAVCFHMAFMIMSNRRSDLSKMTALWLVPIVSVVIVAFSGGTIAEVLPNPQHRLWTLIISYVLWGIGAPLSWVVLVLYFFRLSVHEPLPREVIVSLFLPVGPLSLAGFSLISFGKVAQQLFPITKSLPLVPNAGDILYVVGFIVALILWGFAIIWFAVAIAMIIQARRFPFNMGWWGFVFPVGIFALATSTIGEELASTFFKVLGTVLTVIVVLLWIVIAVGTVQQSMTGRVFFAPCLGTDLKLRALKMRLSTKAEGEKLV